MAKFRILIAAGPYLTHGKAAFYLDGESRYDAALLPLADARASLEKDDAPAPHLCLLEWNRSGVSSREMYRTFVDVCNSIGTQILVAVSNRELKEYARVESPYLLDYVAIPFTEDELLLRVALSLGVRPQPVEEGMTKIDRHLYVNFGTGIVRRGKNNYVSLITSDVQVLKYLFDRINQWVHIGELGKNAKISRLRRAIEGSPKYPRYILSMRVGKFAMYMLHSPEYPHVDSLIGFQGIMERFNASSDTILRP